MSYLKRKNITDSVSKTILFFAVFSQIFGLPFYALAQSNSTADSLDEAINDISNDNLGYYERQRAQQRDLESQELQRQMAEEQGQRDQQMQWDVESQELQQQMDEEQAANLPRDRSRALEWAKSVSGRAGTYEDSTSMNALYPQKLPNEVTMENIGVDFISCMGAALLTKIVSGGIALVTKRLSENIQDGAWMTAMAYAIFGGGSTSASGITKQKGTGGSDEEAKETGVNILDMPIFGSLDAVAFCTKNLLIAYITGTLIKWVNEGFDDAKVFVENWQKVINDAADLAFEKAIGEVNICVHLKGTVHLSALANLLASKPDRKIGRCTIEFSRDYQLVLYGKSFNYIDFENMYLNPNNNALGAYLAIDSRNASLRNIYEDQYRTELGWGNGFWPWKDKNGNTLTPGQIIQDKVFNTLKLSSDNLVISDEWDEVIFTVFNQLIKVNISDSLSYKN